MASFASPPLAAADDAALALALALALVLALALAELDAAEELDCDELQPAAMMQAMAASNATRVNVVIFFVIDIAFLS